MDERWSYDPESHTTASQAACSKCSFEVLTMPKPDQHIDKLSELLSNAAIANAKETIEYLLKLGARPNDKANGGPSALDHSSWQLLKLP